MSDAHCGEECVDGDESVISVLELGYCTCVATLVTVFTVARLWPLPIDISPPRGPQSIILFICTKAVTLRCVAVGGGGGPLKSEMVRRTRLRSQRSIQDPEGELCNIIVLQSTTPRV